MATGEPGRGRSDATPRLARALIERRHTGPTRDALLDDLAERYAAIAETGGPWRARVWYWRQALIALAVPLPGAVGVRDEWALRSVGRDVAHAALRLRRAPLGALGAVIPLGLGIAVVATSFSIVWGTVLAGLPFEEADRLVHFERANLAEGRNSLAVTPHDYVAWRAAQESFEDLGAFVEHEIAFPVDAGPPERHDGIAISVNSFGLLRVDAALGRTFTLDETRPGAPPVLLLSDRLWRSRFGADPGIVGREVIANGRPTTIVGVMPEGFGFAVAEAFWVPLRLDLSRVARGSGRLDVFGRLRDGATLEAARSEFDGITGRLSAEFPETNAGITASLRSFHDEYVGPEFTDTVMRLLLGALLVLVVCCANVANLLLVRGLDRRRDLAVRRALGATHHALVRQLLAEALLISGAAAALGLVLAGYGVSWFNRVGTGTGVFPLPHGSDSLFWWDVSLNGPTLLATVAAAVATAVLAGMAPALTATGASRLTRRGSGGGREGRLQRVMLVGQLGLTTGLLVAAGFIGRSAVRVSETEDRLVHEGTMVMRLSLPSSGANDGRYGDVAGQLRFLDQLQRDIAEHPSARAASVGTAVPTQTPRSAPFRVDGSSTTGPDGEAGVVTAGMHYFDVFGVEPVAGRLFGPGDIGGAPPVAVVNQSFVDRHLRGRNPVGARLRLGPDDGSEPWLQVVGVVPDLWEVPERAEREVGIYVPLAQIVDGDAIVRSGPWGLLYPTVVAAESAPGALDAETLGRHVVALDPTLPVRSLDTMEAIAERRFGRFRIWGRFWSAFAAVALALAGLGIFGVFSYVVAQRTSEIGVRRALGASAAAVRGIVMKRAMVDAVLGTVIGLWTGRQLVEGLRQALYDVSPDDPVLPATVGVVVVLVTALASWVPAQRAARIDPQVAMRAE